jgi:hypothetical protein
LTVFGRLLGSIISSEGYLGFVTIENKSCVLLWKTLPISKIMVDEKLKISGYFDVGASRGLS